MSPEAPVASFSMRKQLAFTIVIVVSVLGSIETRWFEALDDDLRGGGAGADLYIPDAELFWRLRPGTAIEVPNAVYQTRTRPVTWNIQINEEGFRGPLPTATDDAAAGINYGVPGCTTFQGRRLLSEILSKRRPDFVVLTFGANDLESDVASDAAKAEAISPARFRLYSALSHLATARLFLRGADTRRSDPRAAVSLPRVSPAVYRQNLLAMARKLSPSRKQRSRRLPRTIRARSTCSPQRTPRTAASTPRSRPWVAHARRPSSVGTPACWKRCANASSATRNVNPGDLIFDWNLARSPGLAWSAC